MCFGPICVLVKSEKKTLFLSLFNCSHSQIHYVLQELKQLHILLGELSYHSVTEPIKERLDVHISKTWYSKVFCTYLGNQISLRGRSVLKTIGILPSFRPYNYLFCSFLNNGDIKQNLRGNFFWDTLYFTIIGTFSCSK